MEYRQYGSDRQRQFELRLRRILELPLRHQVCCVFLAAEMSLPVWKSLEKQNGNEGLADRFIESVNRWLAGEVSDEQLEASSKPLTAALPDDLTKLSGEGLFVPDHATESHPLNILLMIGAPATMNVALHEHPFRIESTTETGAT